MSDIVRYNVEKWWDFRNLITEFPKGPVMRSGDPSHVTYSYHYSGTIVTTTQQMNDAQGWERQRGQWEGELKAAGFMVIAGTIDVAHAH
jgi:hypothetical protein